MVNLLRMNMVKTMLIGGFTVMCGDQAADFLWADACDHLERS
jgi:hypothetical protein